VQPSSAAQPTGQKPGPETLRARITPGLPLSEVWCLSLVTYRQTRPTALMAGINSKWFALTRFFSFTRRPPVACAAVIHPFDREPFDLARGDSRFVLPPSRSGGPTACRHP